MLLGGFLHRLSTNLSRRKAGSMEFNATSGLRFLDLDYPRDLSSACRRLAKAAEVMR